MEQLGIPNETDEDVLTSKIKISLSDTNVLDVNNPNVFPFFDFTFVPTNGYIGNHLVCKSILEFNIYTTTTNEANLLYKSLRRLLAGILEDDSVYFSGQTTSGIAGVFKFTFRVKPIIKG